MNNRYSFTEQEIVDAAKNATSKTDMMRKLGIRQGGGGVQALDKWCRKYSVTPPKYVPPKTSPQEREKISDDLWFIEDKFRSGSATKNRLYRLGIPEECSICGLGPQWVGKPLTLQIDHIDGNRWNNLKENLRILCPNCHTQTETYGNGRGSRARNYCECGKEIGKKSTLCILCSNTKISRSRKQKDWPEVEEIVEQVRATNFSEAGKIYGCSDNAVRKFLTRNGIDYKTLQPIVV